MADSIIQPGKKECYVTGSRTNLDKHHVMGNTANRKISDQYGLWVWLRHDIHMGLHSGNTELYYQLKKEGQLAFEKKYSHQKWMELFKKNYL